MREFWRQQLEQAQTEADRRWLLYDYFRAGMVEEYKQLALQRLAEGNGSERIEIYGAR